MDGTDVLESGQIAIPFYSSYVLAGTDNFDGLNNEDILLRDTASGRWTLKLISGTTVLESTQLP